MLLFRIFISDKRDRIVSIPELYNHYPIANSVAMLTLNSLLLIMFQYRNFSDTSLIETG